MSLIVIFTVYMIQLTVQAWWICTYTHPSLWFEHISFPSLLMLLHLPTLSWTNANYIQLQFIACLLWLYFLRTIKNT